MAADKRPSPFLETLEPLRELADRLHSELVENEGDVYLPSLIAADVVAEVDRLVAAETRSLLRFALRGRCHAAAAAVEAEDYAQARQHLREALAVLDEVAP